MSIYRTLDEGPTSEMSVQREVIKRKRSETRPRVPSATTVDAQSLRRSSPSSEPLPKTFRWIARLPAPIRPFQLLRRFPRVANALACAWEDRETFRTCLYNLLVDTRGDRKGFPPEVEAELLALRAYHDDHCWTRPSAGGPGPR